MKAILTSATFWRFLGGFALGGAGVLTFHPAGAQPLAQSAPHPAATIAHVAR